MDPASVVAVGPPEPPPPPPLTADTLFAPTFEAVAAPVAALPEADAPADDAPQYFLVTAARRQKPVVTIYESEEALVAAFAHYIDTRPDGDAVEAYAFCGSQLSLTTAGNTTVTVGKTTVIVPKRRPNSVGMALPYPCDDP